MGLMLDSSELVLAERKGSSISAIIELYGEFEDYAISAMTIAELQHGVRRADTLVRKRARELFLIDAVDAFRVLPMTGRIASRVGDLTAELQARGEVVALADIIIAATALEHDLALATHNLRHFQRIRGLRIISR